MNHSFLLRVMTFLRTWIKTRSAKLCLALLTCLLVIALQPANTKWSGASASQMSMAPSNPATLITLGRQHYEAGQFRDAIEFWQQAAQTYERHSDHQNQALSLSYLSLAWQKLGDWQQATQAITKSLELLNQQPEKSAAILAHALNTQGQLLLAIGQADKAFLTWQAAETAYRQVKDQLGTIGTQINQAQALQAQGLLHRSQTTLESATQQLQTQPASAIKAIALRNLGIVWQVMGDLENSKLTLEASLAIAEQLNLPQEMSATLFSLANTARAMQDDATALKLYTQAAEIASPLAQLEIWTNQFSTLVAQQDWTTAQTLLKRIDRQLEQNQPSRQNIYIKINTASNAMKNLQQFSVKDLADRLAIAAQDARSLQDIRSESQALGQLGRLYEQTQQLTEAQTLTQQALVLAQQSNAADIAYRWQWQTGRLYRQQGAREKAMAAYRESIRLLQSVRADLIAASPDLQFSFREAVEPVYREFVSLLVESPSQENLEQARETIEALQIAELENFLRSACLQTQATQVDQVDTSAAVIYPIILPDRLVVIASLPGQQLSMHSVALSKDAVEITLERMLESLNPVSSDQERLQISKQIYDWLIKPEEKLIQQSNIKTLVFVLDGTLRNIPIAALHNGDHYLIEKYSVAIAPGLQMIKPRSLIHTQKIKALVGGLTESRQGFMPLPGVVRESNQIARELATQIFLNKTFTRQNLEQSIQATDFPIVHLATHGQFSSNPRDTFLLTWDDRITIEGLRNLLKSQAESNSTPIELLVLSACETAEGDQRATLGLAGLAVRSGARSTLATLWSVSDDSTADLMSEFYRVLTQQDLSKADVLRQAQLKLLKNPQYAHPFFWAPFILVGNWL
jgi:CHAT domain-containing protein